MRPCPLQYPAGYNQNIPAWPKSARPAVLRGPHRPHRGADDRQPRVQGAGHNSFAAITPAAQNILDIVNRLAVYPGNHVHTAQPRVQLDQQDAAAPGTQLAPSRTDTVLLPVPPLPEQIIMVCAFIWWKSSLSCRCCPTKEKTPLLLFYHKEYSETTALTMKNC